MRIKYLLYIFFIALVFSSSYVNAQALSMDKIRTTKVSTLTDEQITGLWQKATDQGLSEKEIYATLIQNGMPQDEVVQLKDRVTLLGLNKKNAKATGTSVKKSVDFARDKNDTVKMPNKAIRDRAVDTNKKLEIYGADFFEQLDIKFEPNFSVATPKGYVLGPGDQVNMILTGMNEADNEPKISPDGYLLVPHTGLIYLNGLTIEQAASLIKTKMAKAYPAIKTGLTQLTVNLGSTRRINITVNGEVNVSGTFQFSSLSTFFNVLYYSGGPNENGSLRYLQLIRNNKVYKTIDFYSFLQNSLENENIRLEDQDVIHIPVYKKRVSISGEVKHPAIFELKDGETIEDLIKYAGGFTANAYKGVANIDHIIPLGREVQTVNENQFANHVPANGDVVQIGAITNRYTNRVVLEGSVNRPGPYELTAGLTLFQLLKEAQGLTSDAYMERGYIKRTLPNLKKIAISFAPGDMVIGKGDQPLMRDDSVVVMNREAFTSNQKITVGGYVRKPSTLTYRDGLTLADVIAMSGGFADDAADHHVRVDRVIPNQSDTVANKLLQSTVINVDSLTAAHAEFAIQPKDYIFVARLVNYRSLGNVVIKGEVVFPGDYPVQRRNETALDFLTRAGGVTPYGSLENAQVYRKGTRVNLDLASNREMANKVLLAGDSVYVPRVVTLVEISGAVNNPQLISYNGHRFKYYINAVGGTTENARLKGAYIQYPNGLNRPVRHFLFFRNYPTVKPGSKIIVPEKAPDRGLNIGLGDVGAIATALTALVSIIAILHK